MEESPSCASRFFSSHRRASAPAVNVKILVVSLALVRPINSPEVEKIPLILEKGAVKLLV
jgi:hypothetical protein